MFQPLRAAVLCLAIGSMAASCARIQAKTPAPGPVLSVPTPDPRLVIPVAVEAIEPPPAPVAPSSPVTTAPKDPAAPPPRSTPTPTPTPTPAATPVVEPPPSAPQTSNGNEVRERAQQLIERADNDLNKVNRDSLGREGTEQFNSAQNLLKRARSAMTTKNFVYALYLADKAATLAGLLVKGQFLG